MPEESWYVETSNRLERIEVKIDGNGGKGIMARLDDVEMIANAAVLETDCREHVSELKEITEGLATAKKNSLRYAIDIFIRIAPWVIILLTLLGVL